MVNDSLNYLTYTKNEGNFITLSKIILDDQSEYQTIRIAESSLFGKILFLDSILQITENDEAIYHEMMIHPAIASIRGKPKNALILGGGDGCALREILKHDSIKKAILVDIDEKVINICKEYFSDINHCSLENDKVEVRICDAIKYVKEAEKKQFDLVIIDLVDATGEGRYFGSEEFLRHCSELLNNSGVLVTHGNFAIDYPYSCRLYKNLRKIFKHVGMNISHLPSFGQNWAFIAASDEQDPAETDPEKVKEEMLSIRFKYYIPEINKSYMRLPPIYQKIVDDFDERSYSKERKKEVHVFGNVKIQNLFPPVSTLPTLILCLKTI